LKIIYDNIFWYSRICAPFILKYLVCASFFAFESSNAFLIFSSTVYFLIFSITFSFVSPTAIIKLTVDFSCFFTFIALFNATTGSVTNPIFLENGLEFLTILGIPIFPLPVNFSSSISYSKSPIISLFVDKLTAI